MASKTSTVSSAEIGALKDYAAGVTQTFQQEFKAATDRFKEGQVLLDRCDSAIESVLKDGWEHFSAVDEAHNEMCVASALLSNTALKLIDLAYEPTLLGCSKTIDFRAT